MLLQDADKLAGHSTLLSSSNTMYEFLVEDVKPEFWEDYINLKGKDLVKVDRGARRLGRIFFKRLFPRCQVTSWPRRGRAPGTRPS